MTASAVVDVARTTGCPHRGLRTPMVPLIVLSVVATGEAIAAAAGTLQARSAVTSPEQVPGPRADTPNGQQAGPA